MWNPQYFCFEDIFLFNSVQVSRRTNAGEHLMSAIGLSQSWIHDHHPYIDQ